MRPHETWLSQSPRQTQHKSDNSYSFQASPVLLGGALLTLTSEMRVLCLKLGLLAKKRANKPVCFYKIKRKRRGALCVSREGEIPHLPAPLLPCCFEPCWALSTCHLLSCLSSLSLLVAQARGETRSTPSKICTLKRHLTYFTTTTVLRGLGH